MTVVIALSGLTLVNMGTAVLSIGTTDGLTGQDIHVSDDDESKAKTFEAYVHVQFYLTPFTVQNVDKKVVNGV